MPEREGYEYLVKTVAKVADDVERCKFLPPRLSKFYTADHTEAVKEYEQQKEVYKEALKELPSEIPEEPVIHEDDQAGNTPVEHPDNPEPVIPGPSSETKPEEKEISILFGQDQSSGAPLFWHPGNTDEVFHTNTGIIGTMGTGKTQFTQSLVTQLYRERVNNVESPDIGILIFDYKGDYNESKENFVKATNAKVLKPYHLPYNPLALTQPRVFKPLLPIHVANTALMCPKVLFPVIPRPGRYRPLRSKVFIPFIWGMMTLRRAILWKLHCVPWLILRCLRQIVVILSLSSIS